LPFGNGDAKHSGQLAAGSGHSVYVGGTLPENRFGVGALFSNFCETDILKFFEI
jgi:hypothetical protein